MTPNEQESQMSDMAMLPNAAGPGLISVVLASCAPIYMLVAVALFARTGEHNAISDGILTGLVVAAAGGLWFAVLPIAAFIGTCKLIVRVASPPKQEPPDVVLAAAEREVEQLLTIHPGGR